MGIMGLTDVIVLATIASATEVNCVADKGTGCAGKLILLPVRGELMVLGRGDEGAALGSSKTCLALQVTFRAISEAGKG
jgi:hypothetical protein